MINTVNIPENYPSGVGRKCLKSDYANMLQTCETAGVLALFE